MTAGDLAVVLAAVLCCIGFAALIVVLYRVLDTMRSLRSEVVSLRQETRSVARGVALVDSRGQGQRDEPRDGPRALRPCARLCRGDQRRGCRRQSRRHGPH